jgi:hypothetical protein
MSLESESSPSAPVAGSVEARPPDGPVATSVSPWHAAEPFRSFAQQTSDLVTTEAAGFSLTGVFEEAGETAAAAAAAAAALRSFSFSFSC